MILTDRSASLAEQPTIQILAVEGVSSCVLSLPGDSRVNKRNEHISAERKKLPRIKPLVPPKVVA